VRKFSIALDLLFATALAFVTEGRTSPSFVLFVFAIVAGGLGASLRDTVLTASCSVLLYILVIAFSNGLTSDYLMRAVYLAMAGFVIGFFGQQRANFETRLRALEDRVRNLHPALASVRITNRWGGPILLTEGMRPVFGWFTAKGHPRSKNVIVLAGFNGHGVALSVYLGQWAAQALLHRRPLPRWS